MAKRSDNECPGEVDFTGGVRGKITDRLKNGASFPDGSKMMVLDPDVAKVFKTSESANNALRSLASIIADNGKITKQPASPQTLRISKQGR